jgi:hypothetical protein
MDGLHGMIIGLQEQIWSQEFGKLAVLFVADHCGFTAQNGPMAWKPNRDD